MGGENICGTCYQATCKLRAAARNISDLRKSENDAETVKRLDAAAESVDSALCILSEYGEQLWDAVERRSCE